MDGTPTGALVLDGNGNALGGIRSPHLDVPVATLRGTGNSPAGGGGINFCALFGTTEDGEFVKVSGATAKVPN